jgi:hypothetical protein
MRKLTIAGSVAATLLALLLPAAAHAAPAASAGHGGSLVVRTDRGLWPRDTSGRLMSLRPGDQTRTISAGTFAAEHQCSFWNAG